METTKQPTQAEVRRTMDARRYVHRSVCPPPANRYAESCAACPTASGTLLALRHLDEKPRDARGARGILHDQVCMSGCRGEHREEHASRTQARTVAALRRFRAQESVPVNG